MVASRVIHYSDFHRVLPRLPPAIADICRLAANVGCHITEVLRFAQGGTMEMLPDGQGVLGFPDKYGHLHKFIVEDCTMDVAHRVRRSGGLRLQGVLRALQRGCAEAGVAAWTLGDFRKTFAHRSVQRFPQPFLSLTPVR